MIAGIVGDDHDAPATVRTHAAEVAVEGVKGYRIEPCCLPLEDKLPIAQAHSAEISHAAACRVMPQDRVGLLWRHPHSTARTVLLEMDFVHGPQINRRIPYPFTEFFYIALDVPGPHEQ